MSVTTGALQTIPKTETKPTLNKFLTDRLNLTYKRLTTLRRTKKRPNGSTIDGPELTNDWWQTLHESLNQYNHGLTDQSRLTDPTKNIIANLVPREEERPWERGCIIACPTPLIHLTLKMNSTQVVESSVANNSSFQNYPHPDDHTIKTTVEPPVATTSRKRPIFQNTKSFQVKSLYLGPLVSDHLSYATATTLRAKSLKFSFVFNLL